MKIKVLFDKRAENNNLKTGWGVSFLAAEKVLFDTGEKGEWLIGNMRFLGVDLDNIEAIVVSHDHWDHWGGLWDILDLRRGIKVYICPGFSGEFKDKALSKGAKLVETEGLKEIFPDVYTTGEIAGEYKGRYMAEQALILKTGKGISVVTGCAHPGIVKIIDTAKKYFPKEQIYLVMGGFHLMESDKNMTKHIAGGFKKRGVLKAGPTHCSGEEAEAVFREFYLNDFIKITAGKIIEV